MHGLVFISTPMQLRPPPDGAGLLQVLVWVLIPPPQGKLQALQDDHSVQLPSGKRNLTIGPSEFHFTTQSISFFKKIITLMYFYLSSVMLINNICNLPITGHACVLHACVTNSMLVVLQLLPPY